MNRGDSTLLARSRAEKEQVPERNELSERSTETVTNAPVLASEMGNRAFTQLIGRSHGDGILPNGNAHPSVQKMIESSAGRGTKLSEPQRNQFGGALGDPLTDVTLHTDSTADMLSRSVNAHAFAVKTSPSTRDVFFAKGTYQPGTRSGNLLLGEELAHLHQQKDAAMTSQLKISDPNSALEREAAGFAQDFVGSG